MRRARRIHECPFFGMTETARHDMPQRSLLVMAVFNVLMTFRHNDVRGRQGVELFSAKTFDDADTRFSPANVLLDESHTECVEGVAYRVRQVMQGRRDLDAYRGTACGWLHDIGRSETLKNGERHFSRREVIAYRE